MTPGSSRVRSPQGRQKVGSRSRVHPSGICVKATRTVRTFIVFGASNVYGKAGQKKMGLQEGMLRVALRFALLHHPRPPEISGCAIIECDDCTTKERKRETRENPFLTLEFCKRRDRHVSLR